MTAFLFVIRDDNIVIYQDTLVTDRKKAGLPPMGYGQKIRPINYMNMVVCGAGALFFTNLAENTILSNSPYSIDEAADMVSYFVGKYHRELQDEGPPDVQLYLLGVDGSTGEAGGYSITTKNEHVPILLEPRLCCNNVCYQMRVYEGCNILPKHDDVMRHFAELADEFRAEAGIGGDIQRGTITREGVRIETVGRFAEAARR